MTGIIVSYVKYCTWVACEVPSAGVVRSVLLPEESRPEVKLFARPLASHSVAVASLSSS